MKTANRLALVALIAAALLAGWQIPNSYADSSSDAYVEVAILNSAATPSYAFGVSSNFFSQALNVLNKDPYILATVITNAELQAGALSDYDVLFLADNWPAIASNPMIYDFWNNSAGGIVALDSSIAFLCYSGILPEESAGSNGFDDYWDYGTTNTAQVSAVHAVTAGYTIGENITGTTGDARYNVTALSGTTGYPYYRMLANQYANTTWAYVSASAPPDKGRVVHIWDEQPENLPTRLMLINAVKWTAQAPSLAELLGIDELQARVNTLQNQLNTLTSQLNALNASLTSDITSLEAQINALEAELNEVNSTLTAKTEDLNVKLETATLIGYAGVGIGIIGIAMAAVAIILSRRRLTSRPTP